MGCGTSKSAQVVESDITIKDHPAVSRSPVRSPQSRTTEVLSEDGEGLGPSQSDQSGVERTVRELITRPPGAPPPLESTTEERRHGQAKTVVDSSPSDSSLPKPVAFEVCMSLDGVTAPRGPPPRRLAKLDSAPELSSEMLQEKQRIAEERRTKALENKAHHRLSKRDRLRKEVMEAREMENSQRHYAEIDHNSGGERLKAEKRREDHIRRAHRPGVGGDERGGLDDSVEFEVDSSYNVEDNQGWEADGHQKQSRDASTGQRSKDELFFGEKTNLIGNSSYKSEQYM